MEIPPLPGQSFSDRRTQENYEKLIEFYEQDDSNQNHYVYRLNISDKGAKNSYRCKNCSDHDPGPPYNFSSNLEPGDKYKYGIAKDRGDFESSIKKRYNTTVIKDYAQGTFPYNDYKNYFEASNISGGTLPKNKARALEILHSIHHVLNSGNEVFWNRKLLDENVHIPPGQVHY